MSKKFAIPLVFTSDKKGIKEAESGLDGFKKKLGVIAGVVAAAFAFKAVADFTKESVLAAEAVATANAKIEGLLKTQGHFGDATKQVSDRLIDFAKAQEMRIAVDAEVIKGVQGQLLSFRQLSETADVVGGSMDRATLAAFDMATVYGSAESAGQALGKALEDPIRNLGALGKAGITFNDEQRELIKTMVESGDIMGAQNLILTEIEDMYEGVAEATANASDKMTIAFNNIKEEVGAALLPVFNDLVEALLPIIQDLGPQLASIFEAVVPVIKELIPPFVQLIQGGMKTMIPVVQRLMEAITPLIAKVFPILAKVVDAVLPPLLAVMEMALTPLIQIIEMVIDALLPLIEAWLPIFSDMMGRIIPLIQMVIDAFMPLIQAALKPVQQLLEVLIPIIAKLLDAFMPLIEKLLPPLIELFMTIIDSALMPLLEAILPPLIGVVEGLGDMFKWLIDFVLNPLVTALTAVVDWFNKVLAFNNRQVNFKVTGPATQAISGTALQAGRMAKGGVVAKSGLSWVGERGPELLSFPQGATVTPIPQHMRAENLVGSNRGGGQAGNYITINVNGGLDTSAQIGEAVVNAIRKYERTSGAVFVRA
jgi:hypothetical protein